MLKPRPLVSLMLPEQGRATKQKQTATSLLRASPFPKKPGTAQISPRLGASFAPHGTPRKNRKRPSAQELWSCKAQTGWVLSCQEDGSSTEHTSCPCSQKPLLASPALPTPGQPSRSAGGISLSWKHPPDLSRHPTSLIRLFSSPTRLLRLLENISQDLDSSQQRQQSLTFCKVCPKEVGAWPGPRNKPIYNPISPFITSLADGQTGQCCQSSGSQIIIIPSGFGSFSDILLLLRSENQLQITPSQFQKCPWPSRKPAP